MTVSQFLRSLQTRGAFKAAFTSEKQLMAIKKSLFCHWPLIMNFFVAYFSILVGCKTKGTVGAVCALLRIWPLKVPKCQIFDPFFLTPINPIWVGDSRTGEKKFFF